MMVDALAKQSERVEERLSVHQRELASLREVGGAHQHQQQQRGGGGGGIRSVPGSPQRMLNSSNTSFSTAVGE